MEYNSDFDFAASLEMCVGFDLRMSIELKNVYLKVNSRAKYISNFRFYSYFESKI